MPQRSGMQNRIVQIRRSEPGITGAEIGRRVGITREAVRQHLLRLGVVPLSKATKVEEVRRLRSFFPWLTITEVSALCGITPRTTRAYLVKLGIPVRAMTLRKLRLRFGLCPRCGFVGKPNRILCLKCATETTGYQTERRNERLESGTCGRCSGDPVPGFKLCERHRVAENASGKKHRLKRGPRMKVSTGGQGATG